MTERVSSPRKREGTAASAEAPGQSPRSVVAQNIATIASVEQAATDERSVIDRVSDRIAGFAGTSLFLALHCVWFAGWIGINSPGSPFRFDPYPYNLLVLGVSLEAIFLSTFVLRSQNRMARISDRRSKLDLQINLLAESEATKILGLLNRIARRVGVAIEDDPELSELVSKTDVQDVVRALDETESAAAKPA